ncbi:hypothetical protein [Leadbetterella byssophila]|uniref:hypothetical protein n=1 Tax=Leadbetterella byssophila TaxID=316068 RepID=UPI0039A1F3CE
MKKGAKRVSSEKELLKIERLGTKKAALNASQRAVRISKALNIPMQFVKNGKIIEVHADGSSRFIKEIQRVESKIRLYKGQKICLKPKG